MNEVLNSYNKLCYNNGLAGERMAVMEQPIRVLHVLGTLNMGGAESRVMELYRAMNREHVQFDFMVHTNTEGEYSEEVRTLGGNIYTVPRFRVYNMISYCRAWRAFFQEHDEFIAVHGHMTSTATLYLPIAKKVYKKRKKEILTLAHARSAGVDRGIKGKVTKLLRKNLKKKADFCLTCSREAGVAVYGEEWVKQGKVWTIPNAISCNRFQYDETVRKEIRKELGLEDKFVIGHVGRFGFMKNHVFLVRIFAELCKQREDMAMVFIGKGEEEERVHALLREFGETLFSSADSLEKKVLFLGNRREVEKYYQAFDYFVFPSVFEGLPGSVVEAQAAGLHCLVSDRVTREVGLTPLVSYRNIDEDAKMWADEIMANADDAMQRKMGNLSVQDFLQEIAQKGFDVNVQAVKMETFYRTGMNLPGQVTR